LGASGNQGFSGGGNSATEALNLQKLLVKKLSKSSKELFFKKNYFLFFSRVDA